MLKQVKDLLLKIPLYTPQKVEHDDHARLFRLKFYTGTFDCHCNECGCVSTFKGTSKGLVAEGYKVPDFKNFLTRYLSDYDVIKNELLNQIYIVEAECTNKSNHKKAAFVFKVDTNSMEKIGQYPAPNVLAENLAESEEEEFELPFENAHELYRLLNVATEKIGLGSFMFIEPSLRQSIEDAMVLFADFYFHSKSEDIEDWNQEEYDESNAMSKIALLKEHFPEFTESSQNALDVLGNGIYNLSSEECKKHFPLVQLGVEMLLGTKEVVAEEELSDDDDDMDLGDDDDDDVDMGDDDEEELSDDDDEIDLDDDEDDDEDDINLDDDDDDDEIELGDDDDDDDDDDEIDLDDDEDDDEDDINLDDDDDDDEIELGDDDDDDDDEIDLGDDDDSDDDDEIDLGDDDDEDDDEFDLDDDDDDDDDEIDLDDDDDDDEFDLDDDDDDDDDDIDLDDDDDDDDDDIDFDDDDDDDEIDLDDDDDDDDDDDFDFDDDDDDFDLDLD